MNFAPQIAAFATGTYTVTRRTPPTVGTDGRAVAGTPSTFTILASVQCLDGRDLQRLPEGRRVSENRKMYTVTPLQSIGSADTVVIDGDTWEVSTVETWAVLGNYFKVIVTKVGDV